MSRPIHDKDARMEQARAIAAEQQALRALRAQQQQPQFQDSPQTAPRLSEIREISREGLIGSRRLAGDLEGMLRDKPKFFTPTQDSANSVGSASHSSGSGEAGEEAEFRPFLPGERPSDLPVFNPRPLRPNQDENSRDLNLSQENRERAMTQGVPTSATGRAAMELFRRQRTQEEAQSDAQPAKPAAESVPSGESAPTHSESPTATAPDAVDPLLSRSSTNFDRSQVSTAADSLGETRGVTDNELVLHRDDPDQAQNTIRQELSRQSQVEDESSRRADHAQSTLDISRGRERQLNVQREQLESAKAGQRSNADETQRLVESDNQRLEQNTRGVQQLQNAGESSLSRINSLDSQVEQNAQARDQAGSDLQSSERSIQGLQSQVESLQRETPTTTPAGKSDKSNGNSAASAKAEQQAAAAARSQQAITSAQSQLAQAQKQQEDAKRRQQEAEARLQANQQAARQERERLEQTRSQLDQGVQARNASQSVAQQHKAQLQEDLDRVKDLSGHNQDINEQFDDIVDAKARAQASLESNRANASAARQNVEQLRSLSADSAFEDRAKKQAHPNGGESGQSTATDLRPAVSVSTGESGGLETTGATTSGMASNGRTQRGPGPTVQDQGEKTVVRLASLNQGNNSSSSDTSSGASKRRSGAEGGDDLGAASLAAASAASNPAAAQTSTGESFRDSGGRGKSGEDHGNGPPAHSNAGGNGKGRSKG